MQYRKDKYGNDISILGFGCMRFQSRMGKIDFAEAEREIMHAFRMGVNYFDTAFIYPGSEALIGEIFEKNGIREKVRIATKLPHYLIRSREGLEKLFQEELKRLRTDYVDYYLMHMLTDPETWQRLQALGIEDWLHEKQQCGAIRQVGFSYHGNTETFCRLIDLRDWDFCMIQYNYLDRHSQAGERGLHYASQKGLPVMIMEPLRGGRLVSRLPQEALDVFASHPVQHTPAQWAFRWLWNQPEVTCVLSGMNSMQMIEENIETACSVRAGEMTPEDDNMLARVVQSIHSRMKVGCTGCGYCMPCPQHVDIPGTFAAYNSLYAEGKFGARMDYLKCTAFRKTAAAASQCIGCGKCETHCPQQISIRDQLACASRELEGPMYRIVRKGIQWMKAF